MKPKKKSDCEKEWMKGRYDNPRKISPEYHLIVCEGKRTEPNYFSDVRDEINSVYRGRIVLDITGEGENTLSLFETARIRAQNNPNGYKHVWIVYDTDSFPPEDSDETARLCDAWSTDNTTFHAIWSNQCVELWFLLHFSYMHSDLHRSEYIDKLNRCFADISAGEYAKNREDIFTVLKPFTENAVKNAKKLCGEFSELSPSKAAPCTMVFHLMEKLIMYL